jgi:N,N-dimethylformamidase beta subunit-like, C-terminal
VTHFDCWQLRRIVQRQLLIVGSVVLPLVFAGGGSGTTIRGYGPSASGSLLPHRANPVKRENRRAGSRSWSLEETAVPPRRIEGFASEVSLLPGQKVHLHVSTAPAARYRIELYRLGWYHGAGARILACIPAGCHRDRQGKAGRYPQPAPGTGLAQAAWPVTDTFRFPRSTVSGYVLARLVLTRGRAQGEVSYVPLIVRALPSRRAQILVQASVNTWQAYNNWGGKSLYAYNSTNHVPANHVSFSRPTGAPLQWEISLFRFLEREGYDVSYTTDVDTDRNPGELRGHRLVISSGHDEYWTKEMRDAFEAARNRGTNLAFLGADIADWQIRYEAKRRTIVEYRDATTDPITDPALKTVLFQELVPPRPQCELLGITYNGLTGNNDPPRSYRVNPGALKDAWFRRTGFTASSTLPDSVGYEWDGIQRGCAVPPLTVLFRYQGLDGYGKPTSAEAVRYTAPSGARVFSSGSIQFVWGLDNYLGHPDVPPDPRLQRFMRNALADLTSRH